MKDKHQEQNQSDSSSLFHPLSEGQKALWFLSQVDPSSRSYNIYSAIKIGILLDITAWHQTWKDLFHRHSILRTTYTTIEGNPVQQIHAHLDAPICIIDAKDWNEEYLETQIFAESDRLFNLTQGPIIRVCLFHRSPHENIQLITMHHIAGDIWSFDILLREFQSLYGLQIQKNDSDRAPQDLKLLPATFSYHDFVNWQSQMLGGDRGKQLQEYWKHQLHGELPIVDLPFQKQSFSSRAVNCNCHIGIDPNLVERLKRFTEGNTVSLYRVMLTAFAILLYRYVGCEDVLIGSPMAGRFGQEWFKDIVGFFSNIVELRINLAGNPTYTELLVRVDRIISSAQAHQDYPFSYLIRQLQNSSDFNNSELIKVVFNWQKQHWLQIDNALKIEPMLIGHQRGFPLGLSLSIMEAGDRLQASWQFNPELFDKRSIDAMAEHYQNLLGSILSDPDLPISRLSLLNETERYKLLVEWNQTKANYPDELCIHHLFEQQVLRTPDAIAVVCENKQLTYESLNRQANQVAHYLRKVGQSMGCDRVAIVGILMERSIEMIVGVLGILKAGGAYLPLDPSYPKERLVYMLSDSKTPILLTQQKLVKSLSPQRIYTVCIEDALMTAEQENIVGINVTSQDLSYVIYTSGSTGKPKGVKVRHQGLVNVMFDRITNVSEPESLKFVALTASLSFDGSASQIFAPLLVGGTSVIVENLFALPTCPQFQQITSIGTTPSIIDKFIDDFPLPDSLLTLILGGESLGKSLLEKLTTHTNVPKVINVYGPTEATVYCTVAVLLDRAKHKIEEPNIGRPIANTSIYILDSELQPLPLGIAGEVYIGGVGIAQGYLHQPQLTSEKFIVNPFCAESSASAHSHIDSSHLYKTGDLARYLPDGNIEFLGRIDSQVKIRGFRIELGEIETILNQHPDVYETVIIVREDIPNDKRLVAYIVPQVISQEEQPKVFDLRSFLEQHLPNYMIPSVFVFLESLPLTPSGKIDRRALNALPPSSISLDYESVAPRNDLDLEIIKIWEKVLNISPIGMQDNFFELGGHSLLAISIITQIERIYQKELPLSTLFRAPTVEAFANTLLAEGFQSSSQSLVTIQEGGSKPPLFCIYGIFLYYNLARHLGADQPVYGIYVREEVEIVQDSKREKSAKNLVGIAELATRYLAEIKKHQPVGPYFLAGESLGGLVAFEMAHQLHLQGEKVAFLCLLDSPIPGKNQLLLKQRLDFHVRNFLRQGIPYLLRKMRSKIQPANGSTSHPTSHIDVRQEFRDYAFNSYRPQPYPGKAVLFRAMDESHFSTLTGWRDLVPGGLEIYDIPGDHLGILQEPHVQILAEKMKASIERSLEDL